jgi:hypothetical protein
MSVSLPPDYIPRRQLLEEVKDALLKAEHGLALYGPEGFGKTTLIQLLGQEPDIQAAFPDGLFWITLGQQITDFDLRARLRTWVEQLGGLTRQAAPTLETLKKALAGLLQERAGLLVVDDIWRPEHVDLFRLAAPRCRLLLATPDTELAQKSGLARQPMPPLRPDEAILLLEQSAQGRLGQVDPNLKTQIVQSLGYQPLAIKLAGAQLGYKEPGAWFKAYQAWQTAASYAAGQVPARLAAAMSLAELKDPARRLYLSLAIFRKNEPIPQSVIARLWQALAGLSKDQTDTLLQRLADLCLIQMTPAYHPTPSRPTITLGSLLQDLSADELGEAGRLEAHRALLDSYRSSPAQTAWSTIPDEGYLYTHLAYHLDQLAGHDSQASAELKGLFASPDWLYGRVSAAHYTYEGYMADLSYAWRRAHTTACQQIEAGQPPVAIADCARYGLIQTSINALAGEYPPELIAKAVTLKLWSPERALRMSARLPKAVTVVNTAAALLETGCLSPAQQEQAQKLGLAAALAIENEADLAAALGRLAPCLSEKYLAQTIEIARAISSKITQAMALTQIVPHLSEPQKRQLLPLALAATLTIKNDSFRAGALRRLAPHLPDKLLNQALAAIRAEEDEQTQEDPWRELVAHLAQDEATQIQAALLAVGYESARAVALSSLASRLSEPRQKQPALVEALAAARAIRYERARVLAFVELAPHLPTEQKQQALSEAVTTALTIEHEPARVNLLIELIPHLSGELLNQVLAAAQTIRSRRARAVILGALASRLSGQQQMRLLAEALASALAITYEPARAELLQTLGPRLSGGKPGVSDLLAEAFEAALALKDNYARAVALTGLAPYLAAGPQQRALSRALAAGLVIKNLRSRATTLANLAPLLSPELRPQALVGALNAALDIDEPWSRQAVLGHLAHHLSAELLSQAVTAIPVVQGEQLRLARPTRPATSPPDNRLPEALENVLSISDKERRVAVLGQLMPHLSGELKQRALTAALETVLALRDEWAPIEKIKTGKIEMEGTGGPAQPLSSDRLTQVLATILTIEDEWERARALSSVAPQFPGKLLHQALEAILAIENKHARVTALHDLAPHLSGELKDRAMIEAIEAALAIRDNRNRAEALGDLFPQLPGELRQQVLAQALESALAIQDEQARASVLYTLALQLTGQTHQRALAEALTAALAIPEEEARAQILSRLFPLISDRPDLLDRIRYFVIDHLLKLQHAERAPLLRFLWTKTIFHPTIVSTKSLELIAEHIIEISLEWKWL